jgi:predicted nucleotide-binding protein (sugar kinase/HSP70/actin superfamily)
MKTRDDRRIYVGYMADHSHVLAAAMRFHGLDAVVLPQPDDRSLAVGLRLCRGRECLPCFLVVGDVLRLAQADSFDPERSALFLPTSPGPCRFGQYGALLRDLLEQEGLGKMEILGPNAENGYHGFGPDPRALRTLVWQGMVAVDRLQGLLRRYRPYELELGMADTAYERSLGDVVAATASGGRAALTAAMRRAADRFGSVPADFSRPRPLIGIVGEIYLLTNGYSNQNLSRRIEDLGGEAACGGLSEWVNYTNYRERSVARVKRDARGFLRALATLGIQRFWDVRIGQPVEGLLGPHRDHPMGPLMRGLEPYYDPGLGTEAVLTLSKAIAYARSGAAGIVNVLPFACMPGIVSTAMAPMLRRRLGMIPWLDIPYDAQRETNMRTRLEAFMYQAQQFTGEERGGSVMAHNEEAPGLDRKLREC